MAQLKLDQHKRVFSDGARLQFNFGTTKSSVLRFVQREWIVEDLGVYGDVIFSKRTITLRLRAGPLPEKVELFVGPVTVRAVMKALEDFYSTEIADDERTALNHWGHGRGAKTYADLRDQEEYCGMRSMHVSMHEFRHGFMNYKQYKLYSGFGFDFQDSDDGSA